jgi:hypothetical protein
VEIESGFIGKGFEPEELEGLEMHYGRGNYLWAELPHIAAGAASE